MGICSLCRSRSHFVPAVAAVISAFIRSSGLDVSWCTGISFHRTSNLNEVALEAAPVGEATDGRNSASHAAAIITTTEVEPAAIFTTASFTFIGPALALGVVSSSVSEHNQRRNVEKGFNNLLNGAAEGSTSTCCREHTSNLLEDLGHHVPEDKRICNILPLFFVARSGN